MTVQELIDRLQEFNPDSEVRLMTQEQWPFIYNVLGLCDSCELHEQGDDECSCDNGDDEEHDEGCGCPDCNRDEVEEVVFIVEGRQLGYGNKNAWNIAG